MSVEQVCRDCGDYVHNALYGNHVCHNPGRELGYGPGDYVTCRLRSSHGALVSVDARVLGPFSNGPSGVMVLVAMPQQNGASVRQFVDVRAIKVRSAP